MKKSKMKSEGTLCQDFHCEMDIQIEKDKFGKTIKYQIFQGRRYTPFYNPQSLQQIQSFKMRSDDIYLPSYPRTGTHWMYEMTGMLLNGKAETIQRYKGKNQLEQITGDSLVDLPSPRIINTHMRLSDGPKEVVEKKCKIIYNIRDPRDVAVSLYMVYCDMDCSDIECSFEGFFYLFLEDKVEVDGIFDHYLEAEKFCKENPDNQMFFPIFEETHKDPVRTVQRLSDFLELPRNDDLCRAVADKCQFDKMRVDKEKYSLTVDGRSILFRKGIIGDWKNWFTDQMLEDYYRVWDERMSESRFYDMYARPK